MKHDKFIATLKRRARKWIDFERVSSDIVECFTPFAFPDGDHFEIYLECRGPDDWFIVDRGATLSHLGMIANVGRKMETVERILRRHGVSNRSGILELEIGVLGYDSALYDFLRCLIEVTDSVTTTRSPAKAADALRQRMRGVLETTCPVERLSYDHYVPKDEKRIHPVDARVVGADETVFVFGPWGSTRCLRVADSIRTFIQWELPFRPVVVLASDDGTARSDQERLREAVESARNGRLIEGFAESTFTDALRLSA